jgi:3-methyladenine DNA glycosylase/8-oxoguanine DNA glycosylase
MSHVGKEGAATRLITYGPFHLEATVRVLQRRPTNRIDLWESNRYVRLFNSPEGLVLIEVSNRGSIDAPDVRLSLRAGNPSAATWLELVDTVRKILGLDVDPAPLERLTKAVRNLSATASAIRGLRPPRFAGLFEAFGNVVPFQQLSLDAGVAIVGRLVDRLGNHLQHEGHRFHAFPTSRTVAKARVQTLRSCGLSHTKTKTLRYLGSAVESGELTESAIAAMSTQEALSTLVQLPGIGVWSASLVLLRGFGRIDVFPPGDVGAVRGLTQLLRLATPAKLAGIVEHFGSTRGYLYFLSLAASLLHKGLIRSAAQ